MTKRVAVIGAGPAGLAALKALLDEGVTAVGYDKADRPGGLWVRGSSSGLSPAYDSLHLNTSRTRTEFADYAMPGDWPDYPSADLVAGYLADYADSFGLNDHIRFGMEVTDVVRAEGSAGGWLVTCADGFSDFFDAVVVANGHNWDARLPNPEYPGTFTGTQLHAHDYRTPEVFADKRVMVVGMGNSAMDIAVDASYVCQGPVLLSSRHGVFIVPKYVFGRPSDQVNGLLSTLPWRIRQKIAQTMLAVAIGTPQKYGLPAPSGGLFQNHPTISDTILHRLTHGEVEARPGIDRFEGDTVLFTDGSSDRVDVVLWATGYRVTIPFLAERWLGPDAEALPLYERVFHLDDPSLSFVGLIQSTGAALPVLEAQAKLVAAQVSGRYVLPSPPEQQRAVARHLAAAEKRWGADRRPRMRIDFDAYVAQVPRELRAGHVRARRAAAESTLKEGVRA
ncbi:flavin-containing monooxygenase [Salinibacterium hongtaonis]|uniref:Monooxygenase n=1 Tax=Homoserinimonas hongtaonis TaxID=2079791 RepID=A0A2U1SZS5_9MICO|nr:FAD-dependent oxidoreductase [Salinibacterium hongtaonis]PWB97134.1 monooxygenase [Salinibacterium hongtaonis]